MCIYIYNYMCIYIYIYIFVCIHVYMHRARYGQLCTRFSHLKFLGLDFEREHLKIAVDTSGDHLLT